MIIKTLIVTIFLALIMVIPPILKVLLGQDEEKNGNKDQAEADAASACGSCGVKNIANCSLESKAKPSSPA